MEMNNIQINDYNFDNFVEELFEKIGNLNFEVKEKSQKIENKEFIYNSLLEYFDEHKDRITFSLKDHFNFDNKSLDESGRIGEHIYEASLKRIAYMFNYEKGKDEFKKMFEENDSVFIENSTNCDKCDCYVNYYFDLKDLVIKTPEDSWNKLEPCSIKKEIDYKLELDIPSKKIVFTNYFRGILEEDKYNKFSINNYKGMVEHAKAYENDNIGYVFVGNSSPNIYINKDKKNIIAGNYYVLEEYQGYKQNNEIKDFFDNYDITPKEIENIEKKLSNFEEKGHISTDLWAITFMDYNQFIELLNKKGIKEKNYEEDFFIVDIDGTKIEIETNMIENKLNDENHKFSIKIF